MSSRGGADLPLAAGVAPSTACRALPTRAAARAAANNAVEIGGAERCRATAAADTLALTASG
eukprot:8530291-Pyramimonas_sp.AAC.1